MNRILFIVTIYFATLHTSGSVIAEWNEAILSAIRPQTPAPLLLVRNLSIVHRSALDAAIICDPDAAFPCFIPQLKNIVPSGQTIPPELAACYAAHKTAAVLFPSSQSLFNQLLARQSEPYDQATRDAARAIGNACAIAHLKLRENDGISASMTYIPRSEPGQWRRTPPAYRPPELPHGRHVETYVLTDIENYLPPGPPPLNSKKWAGSLDLVRKIGCKNSPTRSDQQSIIARFWSDFSYTITPPGHWNQIACKIAQEKDYTMLEEAHLLAWLNTALLDAGVVCWEAKYRYNFWRPITAIYKADLDNNPATIPDQEWESFLESPPHPEYPSGHASFSGAAARFLQLYFGADAVSFSATSDAVPDHVRTYDSFWECANEISWSRVYGGIHYLFSGDDGLESGKRVAQAVYESSR